MAPQCLADRRLEILRDVSEVGADTSGVEGAAASVVQVLARHRIDVPFAALYLARGSARVARLCGSAGHDTGSPSAPRTIALDDPSSPWPLVPALASRRAVEAPDGSIVIPLVVAGRARPLGVLIAGRCSTGALDSAERTFVALLQHAVASVLFGALTLEEDRARATAATPDDAAMRRQSEHLGLLWETAAVIVTSEDPDTMLRRIFARIREGLDLDTYVHFVVDGSGKTLRRASYGGIPTEEADRIAFLEFGEGLSGTMALERRPIVATSIQQSEDPRVQRLKALGIRTFAGNPLIASGRLLGTLGFASHTRDAFRADELEFLETISHYVTAAYEQFRLIEKLREADRKKDEFLATLAHELRNPLAPIRTGLRVLQSAPPESAAAAQSLAIMERQSAQLTRLIDDLLDVSRITQGKLQVRRSYVELTDVVQSALETASPYIDEARHELSVTLPPEPVMLYADLTRLAQAVSNLLSNAAKYTPRGGTIGLDARRDGGTVVVTVRDNGVGIEPDMLDRVFDKFTQIDRAPEPAYTGLGIGLALVKSLVEMHGGTVAVRSEGTGKGSEFALRLPCVVGRFEVPVVKEAVVDTVTPPPRRRILVVDDNQDAAELLSVAVEMLGHEVRTAHDGVEAIDAAAAFRPAVVLMDLGMPRMNGYEAARRIRGEPWGRDITLVALTGWGQEADKRKTREAGFDHHLVKPAEPATLEAILRGDLDRR